MPIAVGRLADDPVQDPRGDLPQVRHLGWGKAVWLIFVVVLPFLGVLMHQRDTEHARAARAEFDDYVESTAGLGGPAAEIDKAKQLLDRGAITQAEFDAIKAKALG